MCWTSGLANCKILFVILNYKSFWVRNGAQRCLCGVFVAAHGAAPWRRRHGGDAVRGARSTDCHVGLLLGPLVLFKGCRVLLTPRLLRDCGVGFVLATSAWRSARGGDAVQLWARRLSFLVQWGSVRAGEVGPALSTFATRPAGTTVPALGVRLRLVYLLTWRDPERCVAKTKGLQNVNPCAPDYLYNKFVN